MQRHDDPDLMTGIGDEERFVRRVAAELENSLGCLSALEQVRLDAARRASLLRAGLESVGQPASHSAFARALDESAERIPDDVRKRLDAIRAQAIARARVDRNSAEGSRTPFSWRLPRALAVPAGAFASVCVLVTTLALFSTAEVPEVLPVAVSEDGLLIASAEELELYQNLEFYQWLADNGLQN
jgi:hypothetical protein